MDSEIIRLDGRTVNQCRPISIEPDFMPNAEGSALIKLGDTHVICTATVSTDVPRWMRGRGSGWVTAEYGMLPRSTTERVDRRRASTSGRSREIERLIGRSLRAVTDMAALGRTIHHQSIAMFYELTAARAPQPSPAATSHWRWLYPPLRATRANGFWSTALPLYPLGS